MRSEPSVRSARGGASLPDAEEMMGTVPPIRRARGFRLYDVNGRRYLDLYRGGALLGHRAEGTLTALKSVLSQGLASPLPSIWQRRLAAALAGRFPRYPEIRIFRSPERAREAVRACYKVAGLLEVHDPSLHPEVVGIPIAALWRPFLPIPEARALLLTLPFLVDGAPAPVCFDAGEEIPPSDGVPGFILAGALRGLAALDQATGAGRPPWGNRAVERAIDAARQWARAGPYVRPLFPPEDYPDVHGEVLRAGVLLSPGYPGPSVLPGDCSSGESRLLAELFTTVPGG
jgi:hypothetical protein